MSTINAAAETTRFADGVDRRHVRLKAILSNEEAAQQFMSDALDATSAPTKTRADIRLALEELFVNVASYAYGPRIG